jgi:hypothetical protein
LDTRVKQQFYGWIKHPSGVLACTLVSIMVFDWSEVFRQIAVVLRSFCMANILEMLVDR